MAGGVTVPKEERVFSVVAHTLDAAIQNTSVIMAESAFQELEIALGISKTFVIVEMQWMTLVLSMWESTVKFLCQRLAVTMKKSFALMEDTAKMIGRIRRIGLVAVGQIMMDNIVNMIKAIFQTVH
jgi:hypothetical protein